MSEHVVIDGEVVPSESASISVRDRGFLYGDAAFETMRSYAGAIFAWEHHMDRLEATCALLDIDPPIDRETRLDWITRALAANDLEEAAVRLSVTRGVQPGTIRPGGDGRPTVVILVRPLERSGVAGHPAWDEPATVYTATTRKVPDTAIPARAKTHNYLNGILARLDVPDDADEALVRTVEGDVAEGTVSNLFLVEGDALVTPAITSPILPGVTREAVIILARLLEMDVRETTVSPADLDDAEEAFLTNTTWEVRPIDAIDGRRLAVGSVTRRLADAFATAVEANFYRRPAR
ncbi:MAG: aminotransferase class IV [Halobacteriota archaeon]